jgi:hypothetical protein
MAGDRTAASMRLRRGFFVTLLVGLKAPWLPDEFNLLRKVGSVIESPRALPPHPLTSQTALGSALDNKLNIPAVIGDALRVPLDPSGFGGIDFKQTQDNLCAAIEQFALIQSSGTRGAMRALSCIGNAVSAPIRQLYDNQTQT